MNQAEVKKKKTQEFVLRLIKEEEPYGLEAVRAYLDLDDAMKRSDRFDNKSIKDINKSIKEYDHFDHPLHYLGPIYQDPFFIIAAYAQPSYRTYTKTKLNIKLILFTTIPKPISRELINYVETDPHADIEDVTEFIVRIVGTATSRKEAKNKYILENKSWERTYNTLPEVYKRLADIKNTYNIQELKHRIGLYDMINEL